MFSIQDPKTKMMIKKRKYKKIKSISARHMYVYSFHKTHLRQLGVLLKLHVKGMIQIEKYRF